MVRRLLSALLLATCLFGIVQPTFACVSRKDCCPSGSMGGCGEQTCQVGSWVRTAHGSCATRAFVAPASISVRPAQPQPQASGTPGVADLVAIDSLPPDRRAWTPRRSLIANTVFDQSLTYLRTARLRL